MGVLDWAGLALFVIFVLMFLADVLAAARRRRRRLRAAIRPPVQDFTLPRQQRRAKARREALENVTAAVPAMPRSYRRQLAAGYAASGQRAWRLG
jgi:hypothetical protein